MARRYKETIYINRNPLNQYKGWGWIDVDTEIVKRYGFLTGKPQQIMLSGEEEIKEKLGIKNGGSWYCIKPPDRGRNLF